jgi:hypothetical protein
MLSIHGCSQKTVWVSRAFRIVTQHLDFGLAGQASGRLCGKRRSAFPLVYKN